jgi:hypothetical protein
MKDKDKVVSLKFVAEDGNAVDYVMIEGEDVELAKAVATRWAKQNVSKSFQRIEEHQGVMNAPGVAHDTIDGSRIWHLPF